MPLFEIEVNGKAYEVDAPSIEAAVSVFQGASAPQQADTTNDVLKSGGVGLAKGAIGLAGAPGDIGSRLRGGAEWLADKVGIDPQTTKQTIEGASSVAKYIPVAGAFTGPGSADLQKKVEGVTGEFYKPQTTAGEYAQTVGEFAPAALMGPGGLARRAITQAAIPAVTSETAGQLTKGTKAEPYARAAGGVVGAVLPAAAGRIVSPAKAASKTRQDMVQTLANEGVPVTAGQASGSKALQYAEDAAGNAPFSGGKAAAVMERQAEAYTAAALRRAGEKATRATPEVIDGAFSRIGKQFDDLAARNTAVADKTFFNNIKAELDDYNNLVSAPNRAPVVDDFVTEISNATVRNGGVLPGEVYQSLRSRMEATARKLLDNPNAMHAVRGMREALDDAMERSIVKSGNKTDVFAWKETRRQYKNMLVIEKAATGAGENAALGLISPSQLRNATVQQNRRAYARGTGDFADLARAGEAILKPLPNSGTAQRSLAFFTPGALTSAGTMLATGNLPAAALAAGAAVAPGVGGRALMSNPIQKYLKNQKASPLLRSLNTKQNAGLQALLGIRQLLPPIP